MVLIEVAIKYAYYLSQVLKFGELKSPPFIFYIIFAASLYVDSVECVCVLGYANQRKRHLLAARLTDELMCESKCSDIDLRLSMCVARVEFCVDRSSYLAHIHSCSQPSYISLIATFGAAAGLWNTICLELKLSRKV